MRGKGKTERIKIGMKVKYIKVFYFESPGRFLVWSRGFPRWPRPEATECRSRKSCASRFK